MTSASGVPRDGTTRGFREVRRDPRFNPPRSPQAVARRLDERTALEEDVDAEGGGGGGGEGEEEEEEVRFGCREDARRLSCRW